MANDDKLQKALERLREIQVGLKKTTGELDQATETRLRKLSSDAATAAYQSREKRLDLQVTILRREGWYVQIGVDDQHCPILYTDCPTDRLPMGCTGPHVRPLPGKR